MAGKKQEHTLEQFKADIQARLERGAPEGAGAGLKLDGSKLRKIVAAVDAAADKYGPVIATLTPAQYKIFVDLAVQLADAIDERVNPASPDPDPAA